MEKSGKPKKHVLRPLLWWLILVLVLYGIRTHQRLMETTRLEFTVTMQGQPHYEASTTFDGKPIVSGQKIPLGNHTFAVTLPKGEPFSTNLFVWYGDHNLGAIDLKRTMGTLSVTAVPPAPFIFIRGPEWSVTLTNSSGLTTSVPTDQYRIESRYAHWDRADDVTVFSGTTAAWQIAPKLGAVQLSCNQSDATFQLLTMDEQPVEAGGFPAFIKELPEGNYKLISRHHGHQHEQTLTVKAGTTNDNPIEFLYGAAVLQTEPPEASVQDGNGREWGITMVEHNAEKALDIATPSLYPKNSGRKMAFSGDCCVPNGYIIILIILLSPAVDCGFSTTSRKRCRQGDLRCPSSA